jgi:DNA repair photolyase
LSRTSGYLCGYTHSLQPYIGCPFACEYCYVKGLPVHRFHKPALEWGAYVHPRPGIAERLRIELDRAARRGELAEMSIFMSSVTDPYQPAERRWRLARACLEALADRPPSKLVVQTRSPLVRDDFPLLARLGERCLLSITLETDLDEVCRTITPRSPSVASRWRLIDDAVAAGLNVQIAVSPCLPFSSVPEFGGSLLRRNARIVVDTFAGGDGSGGMRTRSTRVPALFAEAGWSDWDSQWEPRELFEWLHRRSESGVGWSQYGFTTTAAPATV